MLFRDGRRLDIAGQPLQVLRLLLAAEGGTVTRQAIDDAVWPEASRIDTTRRMNTVVRALRKALDENARDPEFVETVRGSGYRWRLPVVKLSPAASATRHRRLLFGAAAASALAAAAAAAVFTAPAFQPTSAVRTAAPSDSSLAGESRLEFTSAAVGDPAFLVSSAYLALNSEWDWVKAEAMLRKAVSLDPDHTEARKELAWLLLQDGREAEALCHIEVILGEPSLSAATRSDLGWSMLGDGADRQQAC